MKFFKTEGKVVKTLEFWLNGPKFIVRMTAKMGETTIGEVISLDATDMANMLLVSNGSRTSFAVQMRDAKSMERIGSKMEFRKSGLECYKCEISLDGRFYVQFRMDDAQTIVLNEALKRAIGEIACRKW